MLNGLTILIVESEPIVGLDLATTIEDFDGRAIGPATTVAEALALLEAENVAAAIVGFDLFDSEFTPLAIVLERKSVPFVVYTGTGGPAALARQHPDHSVIRKPAKSTAVLAALLQQVSPDHSKFE